jgi:sugar O-acyltransferase (sialic acid O-acetyltransferase NeuD family)
VKGKINNQKKKNGKNIKYDIVIIGSGGFGREAYFWVKDSIDFTKYQLKGFLTNIKNGLDNFKTEVGIIGDPDTYEIQENDRFIFAIGDIEAKKKITGNLKKKGAQFLTLIHPTAIVMSVENIGEGVIICPFCLISYNVQIGDFTMINAYTTCGHDVSIGKYCILSPYAAINGHVTLEDEVFLGTHATVTEWKKVGYQSKISANSVAMRDIPPYKIVFGVPGKAF